MGLSIHYSGTILHADLIKPLTEEVVDICKDLGWKSHVIDDDEIRGVVFSPKESEPISLTFNWVYRKDHATLFGSNGATLKDPAMI